MALFLFTDQVKFGGCHFAVMDAQAVDLGKLRQILLKLGRAGHPVSVPFFSGFLIQSLGLRRGIGMGVAIAAQFGIALRRGPESIPSKLRFIRSEEHTSELQSLR